MKKNENEIYCAHCGERIEDEDYDTINGQIWCDACIDENTVTCDRCGERIIIDDSVQDDDTTLCQSCYEDYYHRCECCNRIIHDDYVNWNGDSPYCDRCYDNLSTEIEEYSYKPEPIFYGDGIRFFGVELEIDYGGKDDDNARILKEIANVHGEHIYVKSDGSLDEGLELVSHPMSLDYHKSFCWEEIMKKAISMGYRSHQTSTCGLHIHVNRDCFGEDRDTQDEVISRILFFVETHWAELLKFSRRSEYSMNRWAARYGYEKTGKEILDKAKKGGQGRYAAVNLCNYSTIEFRLFRGTLKHNTLIAALELVNAICDLAISLTDEGIANMSWSEFVGTLTEPELIQYLKERKLYINEDITAEEDL
ncbi:amidoligase family protein [Ruminococcus flavefaciens]|uniref:amidoligase family protein n=1 Tax=Ruminococcus flavefaciens TaxID=1265 RepID=UPI0015664E6F|nr:amidoligase family protein [Ruminococcus flavefaciens]